MGLEVDCFCTYRFVEFVEGEYTDFETPAFELPVEDPERSVKFALFLRDSSPAFARILVENADEQTDLSGYGPTFEKLFGHLLTILRLFVNPSLNWDQLTVASNPKAGTLGGLAISTKSIFEERAEQLQAINWTNIGAIYAGTSPAGIEVSYFQLGTNEKMPVQYRYLSLFQLFERRFKKNNKWVKQDRDDFLAEFEWVPFTNGQKSNLFAYLSELRDKCAHPRVGSKDTDGFHLLNPSTEKELSAIIPGMIAMVSRIIENQCGIGFSAVAPPGATPLAKIVG